jgi:hypothetical protein
MPVLPSVPFASVARKTGCFAGVGLAFLMIGCSPQSSDEPAPPSEEAGAEASPTPPSQESEAPPLVALARGELVRAVDRAADATAAGQMLPDDNKLLVGRTFNLKLPFGCSGQTEEASAEWAGWTFDQKRQVLRLTATPERWTDADWLPATAQDMPRDVVEGFWLERPWTSSEGCPQATPTSFDDLPATSERQTVGLAQFFAPDAPRTFQRGGRAYSHTIRIADPADIEERSYVLAVSGRVKAYPDGQPIRCVQDSPDSRPVCVIAVEWARVAFEDARDGKMLVEWRN